MGLDRQEIKGFIAPSNKALQGLAEAAQSPFLQFAYFLLIHAPT